MTEYIVRTIDGDNHFMATWDHEKSQGLNTLGKFQRFNPDNILYVEER